MLGVGAWLLLTLPNRLDDTCCAPSPFVLGGSSCRSEGGVGGVEAPCTSLEALWLWVAAPPPGVLVVDVRCRLAWVLGTVRAGSVSAIVGRLGASCCAAFQTASLLCRVCRTYANCWLSVDTVPTSSAGLRCWLRLFCLLLGKVVCGAPWFGAPRVWRVLYLS